MTEAGYPAESPAGASGRRLDRRQLLKAGAWAAPVIAVAAAVPAASASNPAGPELRFDNFGAYFTDDGAGHRTGVILNGQVSVGYDNSGPGVTGYPVGNVTMTIALPAALFSTASVVTFYPGSERRWTQVGSAVLQGDLVKFTFLSVRNLTTTGPLDTGNLTVGFSSTNILPPGTVFDVSGIAAAPHARSLSGVQTLTVPA